MSNVLEYDSSGLLVARYSDDTSTTMALEPPKKQGVAQTIFNVFLPAGFPASVTEDYVGYQIYDSMQAFSSSIAGLLSSRAVLQGFGVGDANASATNAMLLTILQGTLSYVAGDLSTDFLINILYPGRLATILFAHVFGIALEADCKKYRFLADIFNDLGLILDLLSPVFPGTVRVCLLCLSGSLKALCGVAGGATKASLSVHFATSGNVGELNAKDSSQETVISLLGMLAGSFIVSRITSASATWTLLLALLAVHLATNYKAVRCVALNTLNRQRTNIVFSGFRESGRVLTPKEVSVAERVLERSGVLRWGSAKVGAAETGVRFATILTTTDGRVHSCAGKVTELGTIFRKQKYILYPRGYDPGTGEIRKIEIFFKEGACPRDQVKAWSHALWLAKESLSSPRNNTGNALGTDSPFEILRTTLRQMDDCFEGFMAGLVEAGWNVDTAGIEICTGYRLSVPGDDDEKEQLDSKKHI